MKSKIIQILGAKNSGKTTLIEKLVRELSSRNYKVGTVKHTSHDHDFDRPGTDSDKHVRAGSEATVILSPGKFILHADRENLHDSEMLLSEIMKDKDIILWEGQGISGIPIVRLINTGELSLSDIDNNTLAIVSDDYKDSNIPVYSTANISSLIDLILKQVIRFNH